MYNDKVCEISEVPKLLDRLLIANTRRSGVPISPGGSNRTICVGLNCWMFLGQFPVETVIIGYGSEAIGGWYESRPMFVLPFGAVVAPLVVM